MRCDSISRRHRYIPDMPLSNTILSSGQSSGSEATGTAYQEHLRSKVSMQPGCLLDLKQRPAVSSKQNRNNALTSVEMSLHAIPELRNVGLDPKTTGA